MRAKIILLFICSFVLLAACQKKATTKNESTMIGYDVKILKKITEPTIIAGFYGKVLKYEGDFMPKTVADSTVKTKQPEPTQTAILLFPIEMKDQIEEVKYEEKGTTFYNLKTLKKKNILPKYRFVPNKIGFYQMDLGEVEYCILLEIKGKKGYYNGGLGVISSTHDKLVELDMRVDYKATF